MTLSVDQSIQYDIMASTLVLKFDLEGHRDNSDDSFCGLFINFIMKMLQLQKIYKTEMQTQKLHR